MAINVGLDASGNGNNWITNNINTTTVGTTYDSMTDVPTLTSATAANYCVINPLDTNGSSATITEANLKFANGGTAVRRGTLGITNTKVYWEFTQSSSVGVGSEINYGSAGLVGNPTHSAFAQGATAYTDNGSNKAFWRTTTAGIVETVTPSSFTVNVNDIVQVAYDGTTGKFWFGKNNTWYDGSGGTTGNPSTGSNPVFTLPDLTNPMTPVFDHAGSAYTTFLNCGQRPFAYTPPTGFVALNTFNLPTPTIGATASTQANDYFNILTWTGNSSNPRTISGLGFQPDMTWYKSRSVAGAPAIYDVVRGYGAGKMLSTNQTSVEGQDSPYTDTDYGYLTQNSDGITLNSGNVSGVWVNDNTKTYVGWNWKANGTGVTNTAGSITSTVSANTTSGFSVVTYTGTGSNATIGHGLGVAPKFIIVKDRDRVTDWSCLAMAANNGAGHLGWIRLNLTNAWSTTSILWNNTAPTSSVFSIGTYDYVNEPSSRYVAYCFSEVAGYSKIGTYTGNGSSDGPFIYCGFKPAMIWTKPSSDAGAWNVLDNKRGPYNVNQPYLQQNSNGAEATVDYVDFLSNGFKIRYNGATPNGSGQTILYMAFAENPFKYSTAR